MNNSNATLSYELSMNGQDCQDGIVGTGDGETSRFNGPQDTEMADPDYQNYVSQLRREQIEYENKLTALRGKIQKLTEQNHKIPSVTSVSEYQNGSLAHMKFQVDHDRSIFQPIS